MDEYGGLRPVIESINGNQEQLHYSHYHHSAGDKIKRQQNCANDSFILETILKKYNRHKIPGDSVIVQVEVWVQEITTISDITSDFQVNFCFSNYMFVNCNYDICNIKQDKLKRITSTIPV